MQAGETDREGVILRSLCYIQKQGLYSSVWNRLSQLVACSRGREGCGSYLMLEIID